VVEANNRKMPPTPQKKKIRNIEKTETKNKIFLLSNLLRSKEIVSRELKRRNMVNPTTIRKVNARKKMSGIVIFGKTPETESIDRKPSLCLLKTTDKKK